MQHTRIVAGLVLSDFPLLFQDHNLAPRISFQQPIGGRQTHNSPTDDDNVCVLHLRS